MTLNIKNLQFVRSLIAAAPPENCKMSAWGGYCGSVCCIGGWTEVGYRLKHRPKHAHLPYSGTTFDTLSGWLGMERSEFNNITSMTDPDNETSYGMHTFDSRNTPEVRKAVLLTIFDQLIETGSWNWMDAMKAHGAEPHPLD